MKVPSRHGSFSFFFSSSTAFDGLMLGTLALFLSCSVLCRCITAQQQDYAEGSGCLHDINSVRQKSGTIASPYFPHAYPSNVFCRFRFVGEARERIQITFNVINLNYVNGDASEPMVCEKVDTVTVSTWNDQTETYSIIGVYCGSKIPPRIMSGTNRMLVVFSSKSSSFGSSGGGGGSTGFQASYSFVTDYGIKTGQQDHQVDCRFVYESRHSMEGVFTSPNYPGLYPRNATCEYLFHAESQEQVHVSFRYFDVEGIPPHCSVATNSDFLTISEDRSVAANNPPSSTARSNSGSKVHRYCVAKVERSKKSFLSESNFLRITFHSNSLYDAFGFEAFYQFKTRTDRQQSGSSPSLNRFEISLASSALVMVSIAHLSPPYLRLTAPATVT